MKILSIETSCDETGLALVEASGGLRRPRFKILENLVSSQINIHRPFGGVVPMLAKREHIKNLPILYRKIFGISDIKILNSTIGSEAMQERNSCNRRANRLMKRSFINKSQNFKNQISKIDLIAVTVGPGLEPALWAGITFAEDLYKKLKTRNSKLKLVGANHLEGHLYSFLLSAQKETANPKSESLISKQIRNPKSGTIKFLAVCLLVSGGHTILLLMESLTKWKKLGETRDDAAGEAFDKVGRLLNLPYPGGPEIEKLARKGNPEAIVFPRPMINTNDYDFSFSGLKTSVLYYLREHPIALKNLKLKSDIAASFQEAVVDTLTAKTIRAAREFGARSIILCGGVAANQLLREKLKVECDMSHLTFYTPHVEYNGDNAAMIAAAGYIAYLKNKKLPLTANGDLGI